MPPPAARSAGPTNTATSTEAIARGRRLWACSGVAHPGQCPTNASTTKGMDAGARAADATASWSKGCPRSRSPKVKPVFDFQGLRLISTGLLLEHEALFLIR